MTDFIYTHHSPLESSVLQSVWYNEVLQNMLLKFRTTGDCRLYSNVPYYVYITLTGADSPGQYYNSFIKGRYLSSEFDLRLERLYHDNEAVNDTVNEGSVTEAQVRTLYWVVLDGSTDSRLLASDIYIPVFVVDDNITYAAMVWESAARDLGLDGFRVASISRGES